MAVHFDTQCGTDKTVGDLVLAPLHASDIRPTVVDVGARNGIYEIPIGYAKQADFVGFEPNPVEFEKLKARNTDSMKAGSVHAQFWSSHYHPFALWSENEERTFYITTGPGACTLMGDGRQENGFDCPKRGGMALCKLHWCG